MGMRVLVRMHAVVRVGTFEQLPQLARRSADEPD